MRRGLDGLIESRLSFLDAVDKVSSVITEQDVDDPSSWAHRLGRWWAGGKRSQMAHQAGFQRGQEVAADVRKRLSGQKSLQDFEAQVQKVEASLHGKVDPVIEWATKVAKGKFGTGAAGARLPRWGPGAHGIAVSGVGQSPTGGTMAPTAIAKVDLLKAIVKDADSVNVVQNLDEARQELTSLWEVLESVYGDASPEVRHLENRWQQPVNQWGRMLREIEEAELALDSDPEDADRMADRAFQRLSQIVTQILESQEELNFWFVQVLDLLESVRLAGYTHATMPGRP